MADQEEMMRKKAQKKDQGWFGSMGTTQKILLLIFGVAIFFIVWTFAFGGIQNFYQLIMFAVSFIAIAALFFVILTAVQWYLAPEYFSPKKDYTTRLVNLALDLKPTNVFDLFFMGDRGKKRVRAGKIIGLLGVPYFLGEIKLHEEDKFNKDNQRIAKKGEPVMEYSFALRKKVPVFDKIHYGYDGDTLFVYEAGWFLFKTRHYLRCHRSLHSDLNGDVEVYDINPIPFGTMFEYPFKQIQKEPARVMIQNQLEVILATHEHQYDLISQGVDSAVYFNPYFRLLQKQNAEMVSGGD